MEYYNRILLRYSPHYSPDQLNLLWFLQKPSVLYEKVPVSVVVSDFRFDVKTTACSFHIGVRCNSFISNQETIS
jgi:hypothetical protein